MHVKSLHAYFLVIVASGLLATSVYIAKAMLFPTSGIEVDRGNTVDLGLQPSGSVLSHLFTLVNMTNNEIALNGVRTSCGCTVVGPTPSSIPKHGSIVVPMEVKTGDKAGAWSFMAFVQFRGCEPQPLRIKANLISRLPSEVDFGHVVKGMPITQDVFVHDALDNEQLKIVSVVADQSYFATQLGVDKQDNKSRRVQISLSSAIPSGGFNKDVIFNLANTSGVTIPVTVKVHGWVDRIVEIRSEDVNFGVANDKSPMLFAEASVYSPYGHHLDSVVIRSEFGSGLTVAGYEKMSGGTEIKVKLALYGKLIAGVRIFPATIIVALDSGYEYLPVTCYAAAG